MVRIAILGEYQAGYGPQEGTTAAVAHSANAQGVEVDLSWVSSLDADETRLAGADGLFLSPGPPYLDLERALASIRSGIANGVPLIGTCSGFQHGIVALARNAGLSDATHEEYGLDGTAVITRLECSLAGTTGEITIDAGSRAAALYGRSRSVEEHRCNYGLDARFLPEVTSAGAVVTGRGGDGTPRIVELGDHPFGILTLFVPQLSSEPGHPHPLISGFVAAAARRGSQAG